MDTESLICLIIYISIVACFILMTITLLCYLKRNGKLDTFHIPFFFPYFVIGFLALFPIISEFVKC